MLMKKFNDYLVLLRRSWYYGFFRVKRKMGLKNSKKKEQRAYIEELKQSTYCK